MIGALWRCFAAALAALLVAVPANAQSTPRPDRQIMVMVDHAAGDRGGGYGDRRAQAVLDRLGRRIADRYGLAVVDAWPMSLIGFDCFVMIVPDGRSTAEAVQQVARDREVAWSQPVSIFSGEASAKDPLFPAQPAASEWHLAELHRVATGRGVKVAVVDSGVDTRHPDLAGQIAVHRNFVAGQREAAEQHGTSVAGIIAAKANNGVGIAGVAPGARLLALRACWQESGRASATLCDSFSLAKALYFAILQRADVINLSLSGPDDRLLRELLKVAMSRGSAVVTAFDARRPGGGFPADLPGSIPVSAVAARGAYVAPARDIPTTEPDGRWLLVNGSSFAAAHVSGLAALARQAQRSGPIALVTGADGSVDACATLVRAGTRACGRGARGGR